MPTTIGTSVLIANNTILKCKKEIFYNCSYIFLREIFKIGKY